MDDLDALRRLGFNSIGKFVGQERAPEFYERIRTNLVGLRAALEKILNTAGKDRDGRTYYVLAQDALDGSIIAPKEADDG